jgi:hypothetical protein
MVSTTNSLKPEAEGFGNPFKRKFNTVRLFAVIGTNSTPIFVPNDTSVYSTVSHAEAVTGWAARTQPPQLIKARCVMPVTAFALPVIAAGRRHEGDT